MFYVTNSLYLIAIACMIKNKKLKYTLFYIVYSYFNIKHDFTIKLH